MPSKSCGGEPIDLVLMDIMMPELDGYETIRRIRANEKEVEEQRTENASSVIPHPSSSSSLPIIAITAKALKEDREKCLAAGADDYLPKPLDYDTLISLVEAWCWKREK